MDWEKVERTLERSFRAKPERCGEAVVIRRRRPLALAPVLESAITPDEAEAYGSLADWPGSVACLLEEAGAGTPLLGFYWDGFGPISWVAGLWLVGTRERRYLCVWDECESFRAVAAIEPGSNGGAVTAAVSAYLAGNGSRHGDALMGSLPRELFNHRPDLLAPESVRQALFDFMQRKSRQERYAWSDLASEHYGRLVEPDHLQRCLDLLEGLPRLDDPDAVDAWLAQEGNDDELSDEARQRLFDEWFAGAYGETRVRG